MYDPSGILTAKCINNTFAQAVKHVNILAAPLLLAFNLKNYQSYIFSCRLASRSINHTFLHALKFLNILVAPSLTHFSLWRHHRYLACHILSWKDVTRTWLVTFQPLSTFLVASFVFSPCKYIWHGVLLSLNPLNRKLQYACSFKTPIQLRYTLLPISSPLSKLMKLIFFQLTL